MSAAITRRRCAALTSPRRMARSGRSASRPSKGGLRLDSELGAAQCAALIAPYGLRAPPEERAGRPRSGMCPPLWHARRLGGRHVGLRILIEQEAVRLKGLRCASDPLHIGGVIRVALLQRRPRIPGREPRGLGLGEIELLTTSVAAVETIAPQCPARIARGPDL